MGDICSLHWKHYRDSGQQLNTPTKECKNSKKIYEYQLSKYLHVKQLDGTESGKFVTKYCSQI